jgi:hypothetical protein
MTVDAWQLRRNQPAITIISVLNQLVAEQLAATRCCCLEHGVVQHQLRQLVQTHSAEFAECACSDSKML